MGYFSNGTEGMMYEEEYCSKCVHFDDGGCAVWLAHQLYNYEHCNDEKSILHILIPRTKDDVWNDQCAMFYAAPALGDMFADVLPLKENGHE